MIATMTQNLKLVDKDDPILHRPTRKVLHGHNVDIYKDQMIEIMWENSGIAIAANQVGLDASFFIAKIGLLYEMFINPTIQEYVCNVIPSEEGCLSNPGVYNIVPRYETVIVAYQTLKDGLLLLNFEEFNGLEAIIMQHEIDHLNGVCIFDGNKNEKEIC